MYRNDPPVPSKDFASAGDELYRPQVGGNDAERAAELYDQVLLEKSRHRPSIREPRQALEEGLEDERRMEVMRTAAECREGGLLRRIMGLGLAVIRRDFYGILLLKASVSPKPMSYA